MTNKRQAKTSRPKPKPGRDKSKGIFVNMNDWELQALRDAINSKHKPSPSSKGETR